MGEALAQDFDVVMTLIGLSLQAGGILTFNIIIINTLGSFTTGETILLKVPCNVIMVLSAVLATVLAQRTRQLCYSAIFVTLFSFAGSHIVATADQTAAKLAAPYLTVFWSSTFSILTATIGVNVKSYSKAIFYNGAPVICMAIGNIIGPLIMLERQALGYTAGMTAFCIGSGVTIRCLALVRFAMQRTNLIA
ncbi:hypothetical protein BJV82DRAFT_656672 [Fennellomyces sp. T-0311]|nr:hypothetical protein BJV82DRAFT_656672 [Fennellomyces sp. T-0311]